MQKKNNFLSNAKSKVAATVLAAQTMLYASPAKAGGLENIKINPDLKTTDPFEKMGNIIGLLLSMLSWVGIVAIIYGGYEVFLGFTQDGQMEKKTKGFIWMFAGVFMCVLKWLLGPKGLGFLA